MPDNTPHETSGVHEDLRRQYEQAWHSGTPPTLSAFVPDVGLPGRLDTLIELVCIEIEYSWKRLQADNSASPPKSIDEYLHQFPELQVPHAIRQLVEQELTMRRAGGHSVSAGGYAERYPDAFASMSTELLSGRPPSIDSTTPFSGAMPERLPSELGQYTLVERIGEGGMGCVYRARHQRLGSPAAIKILKESRGELLSRFHREARAAANLRHPHIAAAFDAGEEGSKSYIVFEFVEGENLRQIVTGGQPLEQHVAVNYIRQAALGLGHAHSLGFVHRDVKPANLMLDTHGNIKVLDLGLASARADDDWTDATSCDALMGTIDYMAPEQGLDPRAADERADIYGLGCTLYFLLTGKRLYDGDSVVARLVMHREYPIPSLLDVVPNCAPELDQLFRRMVAKRAEDRPTSMQEVINALDAISNEPRKRSSRQLITVLGASAITVAVIVTMIALALTPASPDVDDGATALSNDTAAPRTEETAIGGTPRRRALQLLELGATLDLLVDNQKVRVAELGQIPSAPFGIVGIDCRGSVSETALVEILRETDPNFLGLQGSQLTSNGLKEIVREAPSLEALHLGAVDLTNVDLTCLIDLERLQTLWIGRTNVADDHTVALAQVESLAYLWIGETSITDAGVERLATLPNLVGLGLEYTQVSGVCLRALEKTQLVTLILDGTAVSDDDIPQLGGLTTLQGLSVKETRISEQGQQRLLQRLPDCQIDWTN